jgi:aspartyl-tRNA(Asn)/glutamyl-tRNA(Gln) amidotransferase subunit A
MKLNQLTIKQAHDGLKKKEFSSVELTKAVLGVIKEKDKDINAFLTITEDLALGQAEAVDKAIAAGEEISPLAGIPTAIKDCILVDGIKCTAGSKILENYTAPYDASVIKKLKKEGAVIVGKTNMDEFAMGASTENSAYGPTKNPRDLERVPGGSSGGSAAAVAADEAICSLGSDTGGSIRQPAGFCGVVGIKPTYGRVSRYGLMAMASSLDQIGPLAKSVEDAAEILRIIEGVDEKDSTSVSLFSRLPSIEEILEGIDENAPLKGMKIGIPNEYFAEGIAPEVEKSIRQAITKMESLGAEVSRVSLPHSQYALACYYIIVPSEVSANLARYDGIKYGVSAVNSKQLTFNNLLDIYFQTRGKYLGKEVRRRIILGTYALSAGYYDAYYLRAQKVRTLVKQDFERAFEKVDILVAPTSPTTAFKIGEKADDPLQMYLADIYTVPINLAGIPALSMPCGVDKNGLPIGLQIIGKHFDEKNIIKAGLIYEKYANN